MSDRGPKIENADGYMAIWPWQSEWKIAGVFSDRELANKVAEASRGGKVLALYSLDEDFHPVRMMPPKEGK